MATSAEYHIWHNMIQRCHDPEHPQFPDYGGRGITVCRRWRNSVALFIEDMGKRPARQMTIERQNNNKGYNPQNCCWADRKQQARNRRSSVRITYMGETLTIAEWSERTGIHSDTLRFRLRAGWPVERIIEMPVSHGNRSANG